MASTWGQSWLSAWGNSWGPITAVEERPAGGDDFGTTYLRGTETEQRRLDKLEEDYRKVLEAKEQAEQQIQAKQDQVKELKKPKKPKKTIKTIKPDEELAYLLREQIIQELLIEIAEQQAILSALNDEENNLLIMIMVILD